MISLTQIELLLHNAPNKRLIKYTNTGDFFLFFLTQLQDFFEQRGKELIILEPLFEVDAGKSEVTTIGVDGEEFGQIFFLVDELNFDLTLFFYSEEFSHKFFLLENEQMNDISIKIFHFWLNSLFGIHSSYIEDKNSEKKER